MGWLATGTEPTSKVVWSLQESCNTAINHSEVIQLCAYNPGVAIEARHPLTMPVLRLTLGRHISAYAHQAHGMGFDIVTPMSMACVILDTSIGLAAAGRY